MFVRQLVVVCLLLFSFVSGQLREEVQDCFIEQFRQVSRCASLWGYNTAGIGGGPEDIFNITRIISYCRVKSPNITECLQNAYGQCDDPWLQGERAAMVQTQLNFMEGFINYLCSETDVLQRDKSCLERVMGEVTNCSTSVVEEYSQAVMREVGLRGTLPWDIEKQLMRSTFQNQESCIYRIIERQCSREAASIFGNFLYAFGVHALGT